ncbi:cyclic nucleotide-binding domain-containing protein [Candidatus Magnetominusculus xianensis]|uniref:Bacteriocin-type transport-associated protein n=1 Tax=Candidatus Magnetominusculus xianensis TaxID=1748249 RepID=A0ABR5SK36_9BACT|nr:cyclic nucleotide-binding domain-containing protein [Candidatus Magnetominusculus xianensis]KWT86781.1 bacteriocin-type transport-associated protein [Candidatus Magnetominusculus xianensis]MBF0402501.1 cyclic nucleotide-binding domain-containing protein [Nitrospirota bacterium]
MVLDKRIPFYEELHEDDIQWILNNGIERMFATGVVIIQKGELIDCIYVIIDGFVGLYVESDRQISTLGPGELLGERSYLEGEPFSFSAIAENEVHIIILPRDSLNSKLSSKSDFANRFYKTIAISISHRLRDSVGHLTHLLQHGKVKEYNNAWNTISENISDLKEILSNVNKELLNNDITQDKKEYLCSYFDNFHVLLNTVIGEDSHLNVHIKETIGFNCQKELFPYILLTNTLERMYVKPLGYAGDYLTIKEMYDNKPSGKTPLGTMLDNCVLNWPAAHAVRNRRIILVEEIKSLIESSNGNEVNIASIACGPAEEIFDAYKNIDNSNILKTTL